MINAHELLEFLPLTALYAETHYRFRFFPFSLYYRRRPEIIFDTPRRIQPDSALPIYCIIKDAHRFPIKVERIKISITDGQVFIVKEFNLNIAVKSSLWHKIFDIDVSNLSSGILRVETTATIRLRNKTLTIRQDNHPGLSHSPFLVLKAADPLPLIEGWTAGELHCHTEYGQDHIEFGPPPEIYQSAAKAMGLGWVALTDHSYDLDDYPDNFLIDDPDLRKWHSFLRHTDRLNQENEGILLIPGEELSCRSSEGRNIHMLLVGQRNFLKGTGDDAQKWLKVRSELTVSEALKLADPDTFAAAAHPLVYVGWLERFLINRGMWRKSDLYEKELNGWQILNGQRDEGFQSGLREWSRSINDGLKKYIAAGNDAHGNLNRYRQVKLPMISLCENQKHLFGKVTTHISANPPLSANKVTDSLKKGKSVISEGPALELTVCQGNDVFHTGEQIHRSKTGSIRIRYRTTEEFGTLKRLRILTLDRSQNISTVPYDFDENSPLNGWCGEQFLPLRGCGYIRAELTTQNGDNKEYYAYTNPVWLLD